MAAVIGTGALRSAFVALVASLAPALAAQQNAAPVDPVIAHFREYRAALERNDLPAAETAAAAALAASQAANGRRTAVLALNLANLRLELDGDHDALTPARTAHGLATASASSGVDPAAAALTFGRAEIAADESGRCRSARSRRSRRSAPTARSRPTPTAPPSELGVWAIGARDYATARQAWATAARLSARHDGSRVARARALTGEGASIFLASSDRLLPQQPERSEVPSTADAKTASDAFATAQRLLMPAAYADTPSGAALTVGQVAYAEAMAWQSALFAKLQSRRHRPAARPDVRRRRAAVRCRCAVQDALDSRGGELSYPPDVLSRFGVGSVVVHFGLDSAGAVTSRAVAAAIPAGALAEAVEDVADEWRIEKDP